MANNNLNFTISDQSSLETGTLILFRSKASPGTVCKLGFSFLNGSNVKAVEFGLVGGKVFFRKTTLRRGEYVVVIAYDGPKPTSEKNFDKEKERYLRNVDIVQVMKADLQAARARLNEVNSDEYLTAVKRLISLFGGLKVDELNEIIANREEAILDKSVLEIEEGAPDAEEAAELELEFEANN